MPAGRFLHAPTSFPYSADSAELSVVHANRSAALYHRDEYHLALQDIELALQLKYPKHLLYKLYDRWAPISVSYSFFALPSLFTSKYCECVHYPLDYGSNP